MDIALNLHAEYRAIMQMYKEEEKVPVPIKAFFGNLVDRRHFGARNYPITRIDRKINLDQLLAINNAMDLLKHYEEKLDLKEREETLQRLLEYLNRTSSAAFMLPFQTDLQGRQLQQVKERIAELFLHSALREGMVHSANSLHNHT